MSEDYNLGSIPPPQSVSGPQGPWNPAPPPPVEPTPKKRSLFFLWGIPIGILLALICLLLFYKFLYPGLERQSAVAKLDPAGLANANVLALQGEIDRYKAALNSDVCLYPPLSDAAPLFRNDPLYGTDPNSQRGSTQGGVYPHTTGDSSSIYPPPENPEAGDLVEISTVFILSVTDKGEPFYGTGFFINNREIITNRHVVAPADGHIISQIFVTNKSLGKVLPVRIKNATSPKEPYRDYAVLELPGSVTHPGYLKFATGAKRTDRVGSWGYPGLNVEMDPKLEALMHGDPTSVPEVVFTNGVISVIQDYESIPIINHTAEVSHGNSGGPLVDQEGNVLGINTVIFVDKQSNRQLNIALGSEDVVRFLRASNLQFDQTTSKG
jgi:V8-like Glu-specific endopeptidase